MELHLFLGILNYLSKFSLVIAEVCKPLKAEMVIADWTWNGMYQDPYDRARKIVRKDSCMKFYDVSQQLYLETYSSGVSLGVRLLEISNVMNCGHDKVPDKSTLCTTPFASKSL